MTSAAAPHTATAERKNDLVLAAEANEWGQVTGLEPHAAYFVVRKPTAEMGREKTKEITEKVKAFLDENRLVTEQQLKQLNERYGEPARHRIQEMRQVLETRFDEISKEIEERIEKLEAEYGDRIPKPFRGKQHEPAPPSGAPVAETPGEMPTGEGAGNGAAGAAPAKPAAKKGKKGE